VATDGKVDRPALAAHAFATDEDRRWLEQLLWPRVGERVMAWRAEVEARDPPPVAAVVEVPLLFEAGHEQMYDATLAVTAPEDVRAQRAGARGHAAVDERHARQLPQEEKARRATHEVVNDGTEEELAERLTAVLARLRPR
jgi:dephospho-CoA kinase